MTKLLVLHSADEDSLGAEILVVASAVQAFGEYRGKTTILVGGQSQDVKESVYDIKDALLGTRVEVGSV